MKNTFRIALVLALAFTAVPFVHAAAGDGDGSVQPGGACVTADDCDDLNGVDYICDNSVCVQSAGTAGDTCADSEGCTDQFNCLMSNGQPPSSGQTGTCVTPGTTGTTGTGGGGSTGATAGIGSTPGATNAAANTTPSGSQTLMNPLGSGGINTTYLQGYYSSIAGVINGILVPLLIAIAFITFLWGVYRYFILGADDDAKRQEGRTFVLYGIIGFVVIIAFWGLVGIVGTTIGLSAGGSAASHGITPPTL